MSASIAETTRVVVVEGSSGTPASDAPPTSPTFPIPTLTPPNPLTFTHTTLAPVTKQTRNIHSLHVKEIAIESAHTARSSITSPTVMPHTRDVLRRRFIDERGKHGPSDVYPKLVSMFVARYPDVIDKYFGDLIRKFHHQADISKAFVRCFGTYELFHFMIKVMIVDLETKGYEPTEGDTLRAATEKAKLDPVGLRNVEVARCYNLMVFDSTYQVLFDMLKQRKCEPEVHMQILFYIKKFDMLRKKIDSLKRSDPRNGYADSDLTREERVFRSWTKGEREGYLERYFRMIKFIHTHEVIGEVFLYPVIMADERPRVILTFHDMIGKFEEFRNEVIRTISLTPEQLGIREYVEPDGYRRPELDDFVIEEEHLLEYDTTFRPRRICPLYPYNHLPLPPPMKLRPLVPRLPPVELRRDDPPPKRTRLSTEDVPVGNLPTEDGVLRGD